MKKVGFISLGCPKNQVDGECMLASLTDAGYEIADPYDGADVVIINTCGFIESAKAEAIQNILDMAQLKEEGTVRKIVVTGCLAERYRDEIKKEIPEADAVIGLAANKDIVTVCDEVLRDKELCIFPPKETMPLCGSRVLTTPEYYAYVKIADGCDNRCSYCAIPNIRGGYRSREMEDIIDEVKSLGEKGVKEIILVAQDTTLYGRDIYGRLALPELLRKLCALDGIEWIRLMYCYPDEFSDELIRTIKEEKKVLDYIDLPLQHADDRILKLMNRRGTAQDYEALIKKLRAEIPDICIRTTFITGFPGEDEAAFENLALFINRIEFDRLGCFTYSAEEDTPAAGFDAQLDEQTKVDRKDIIMNDQFLIVEEKGRRMKGRTLDVLVEGYDGYTDSYFGRSYMDAPEIDGSVKFTSEEPLEEGDICRVEIFGFDDYDLIGEASN